MTFPAILVGAALLLVSIPIVAEPLLRKARFKPLLDEEKPADGSKGVYEQTLMALRDLDFDHQLGLVAQEDYQQIRASFLAEAAEAYEQRIIDEGELERLIEAAVRDRRQQLGNGLGRCTNCGADLDPADRYCTACGSRVDSTCPHCNQPIERGDNFCTSCGAQLAIAAGVVE